MSRSRYQINPLVVLGVPTLEPRPLSWKWLDFYLALQFPLGASIARSRIHGKSIADARNAIVEEALARNATYVFFLGDDVEAAPNSFDLMWRHRQMLVTGVYWSKTFPSHPYLWDGLMKGPKLDWKLGEFFPVDWAGCDCLLVHTDVFRTIEPPWFNTDWSYESGQKPAHLATEDLYFYTKAREAGFRLYCESLAQCNHEDRGSGHVYGLTDEMPQYKGEILKPSPYDGKRIADLGSGFDTPHWSFDCEVTRFDADPAVRPDVLCDLRALPSETESFDVVHARHVLEHFMLDECQPVVREWLRVLKVGGEFIVTIPNLAYAAQEILKADADPTYDPGLYVHWQLFGRQDGSPNEVHKGGFTRRGLERLLRGLDLDEVTVETSGNVGENLTARAVKRKSSQPYPITEHWIDTTQVPAAVPANGHTSQVPALAAEEVS